MTKYLSVNRYCVHCRGEVHQSLHTWHRYGWCHQCRDTVACSHCKVSYWIVTAALVLPLMVALPCLRIIFP